MTTTSGLELFTLPPAPVGDYAALNEESRALWKAYAEGRHPRIPVRFNTNPRILMLDPAYNTRCIQYEQYFKDPELMAQVQLEWQYWIRHFLPGDLEKGLPEQWPVWVDFQNCYDALWFGCPIEYRQDQIPDTKPILDDDHKRLLFDRGLPEPLAQEWAARHTQYRERLEEKAAEGWTFLGKPVVVQKHAPFMGGDGVFTAACSLRGCANLCLDLLMDPDYAHELLSFVHEAMVTRMKAWWNHFGVEFPRDNFGTADDSVEMLSVDQYREFMLPLHRKLYETFATDVERGIHLCGNAQRLFPVLKEEIGVRQFDTGFPMDFALFREEMGPEVQVSGGPAVAFFVSDDPGPAVAEAERILRSGVLRGGRFILQEGNNLPPCANLETCARLHDLAKTLGVRGEWW